ncbi:hypothetical protein [Aestuariivirga sp.]|uniref:hypothetical protein n=1 Tax=Aestuariivirga sp. TaxID=2650926 RepID=UPI0039E44B7C
MMEKEILNAIICSASIDDGDRGILNSMIDLDYGGAHQGFGGYCLYLPKSYSNNSQSASFNYAGVWIWRVMEVAGVTRWKDLPGKTVRADIREGMIYGIGHIIKDDWFYPKEVFAEAETRT